MLRFKSLAVGSALSLAAAVAGTETLAAVALALAAVVLPVRALAALVASLLLIESLTRLHEPTSKLRKHHALRESGPE